MSTLLLSAILIICHYLSFLPKLSSFINGTTILSVNVARNLTLSLLPFTPHIQFITKSYHVYLLNISPVCLALFSVLLHLSIHSAVIEFFVTVTVPDSGEAMVNKMVKVSALMMLTFE